MHLKGRKGCVRMKGFHQNCSHSPLSGPVPLETKVRCLMVTAPLVVKTSHAWSRKQPDRPGLGWMGAVRHSEGARQGTGRVWSE